MSNKLHPGVAKKIDAFARLTELALRYHEAGAPWLLPNDVAMRVFNMSTDYPGWGLYRNSRSMTYLNSPDGDSIRIKTEGDGMVINIFGPQQIERG